MGFGFCTKVGEADKVFYFEGMSPIMGNKPYCQKKTFVEKISPHPNCDLIILIFAIKRYSL